MTADQIVSNLRAAAPSVAVELTNVGGQVTCKFDGREVSITFTTAADVPDYLLSRGVPFAVRQLAVERVDSAIYAQRLFGAREDILKRAAGNHWHPQAEFS